MEFQKEVAYFLAFVFPAFTGGFPWLHRADQSSLLYDSVEVKIIEQSYDPSTSHFSHVGVRVKRSTDAMPDSLHFQIRYGSREQNIRMRRNALGQAKDGKPDVPDFPVFVIENGRIKRKELQHDKGIALYSNESTGSSFIVRKRSNRADFILNGVFYDGLEQLSLTRDANGGLHQIHKQNGVVDFRNDYINALNSADDKGKIQERATIPARKPRVRSKRQLVHAGENEVELFMIADNKDYRTWLKYYRHNSTLTEIEMNLYYAFIANSMNVRYSSIKTVDSSFSLKILISGLLIVNSQKVSTWTEDNFDPITHCVDAARALQSFRLWIKSSRHDLPPSDHWMLFTGFDISTDGNRNVAGLAKLGGMCSLNSVSLIEQDNTGSVGATAAHELGHSLSALHDGEEKDCVDEDNYIMSRKLKTPDVELLASRPWQFSPCSVRAFKKFISESQCTQKSVRGMSVLSTSLSPGQVFSADLQCQLALGNGSYFGRSLQLREGYPSMCRRMWCAVPDDPGFYQGIFALENTSCGDGKWCQQGQCIQDPLAPRMEDSCPQGDDPTAPCALDDCAYYTNRNKLVYCCHTCRHVQPWQEDRPLVAQVVRQIEVSPVTLNPPRFHDVVDTVPDPTIEADITSPDAHHNTSASMDLSYREQSTAHQRHTTLSPPLNDPSSITTVILNMSPRAKNIPATVEPELGRDPVGKDNDVSQSTTIAGHSSFIVQQATDAYRSASTESTAASTDVSARTTSPSAVSTTQASKSDKTTLPTSYNSTVKITDEPQVTAKVVTMEAESFVRHSTTEVVGGNFYIQPDTASYPATTTLTAAVTGVSARQTTAPDESTTVELSTQTRPRHVLYNIMSEVVSSNITLSSLLSLLISGRNATTRLRKGGRMFGQNTTMVSGSEQSHASSETTLSPLPSVNSRNDSFDDHRHGSNATDYIGKRHHLPAVIRRTNETNNSKTFNQLNPGNGTYNSHQTPLPFSESQEVSFNITTAATVGRMNTTASNTHAQNNSLLGSDSLSLRSSNASSTHSSQNNNLTHKDYNKQLWKNLHLKTNKIVKNTKLTSVAGQPLVSSDELGGQGQVAAESLQGHDLLKTLSSEGQISHDNSSEPGKPFDFNANTLTPAPRIFLNENRSLTSVHTPEIHGRLFNRNGTQTSIDNQRWPQDVTLRHRVKTTSPVTAIVNDFLSQSTQMSPTVSLSTSPQIMTPQNILPQHQANSIHDAIYPVPDGTAQNNPVVNHLDLFSPMLVYTQNLPSVKTAPNPNVNSLSPHISNGVPDFDKVQNGHADNDIQNVNRIQTLPRYQDVLASDAAINRLPVAIDGQRTAQLANMENSIPKEVVASASVTDQVVNGLDHNVQVHNLASSGTFWAGLSNNAGIHDGSQYKPTI